MPEVYGVENLWKMIKFGLSFTKQIAVATKDGFQWTDIFGFLDEFAQASTVIKSWEEVKKELADLSPAEKDDLNNRIAADPDFQLDNQRTEFLIEHSLQLAVSAIALVQEFKNKPIAPPTTP